MADMILPDSMEYDDYVMSVASRRADAKQQIQKGPTSSSANPIGNNGFFTFDIEGQQAASFLDGKTWYFNFNLTNTDGQTVKFPGSTGGNSLIDRIVIETATGKKIDELQNYNNFVSLYNSINVSGAQLKAHKTSQGTSEDLYVGASIATTLNRYFSLPISHNVLAKKHYPLIGNVGLRIRIYFSNLAVGVIQDTDTDLTASQLTITDPLLIYDVVTLEDDEMEELYAANDYKFELVGDSVENQFATLATVDTAKSVQMGFSKKIAKKIYGTLRNSAFLSTAAIDRNAFSHDISGLTDISLLYNGKKVNGQTLTIDSNYSRVWIENMKSEHRTLNSSYDTSIDGAFFSKDDGTGLSNGECGQFYFCLDLTNGLQIEDEGVVSGKDVQMGNFSIKFLRTTPTNEVQLDLYLVYENKMTLDMSPNGGSGVWEIEN